MQSATGGVQLWDGDAPAAVVELLADLTVTYRAHGSASARVVANLVDSAISHKINRSIEDPTFLSKEMLRCNISQNNVKTVMALYKQRCLANPALHLKESVEEAALRFMEYGKVAVGTHSGDRSPDPRKGVAALCIHVPILFGIALRRGFEAGQLAGDLPLEAGGADCRGPDPRGGVCNCADAPRDDNFKTGLRRVVRDVRPVDLDSRSCPS